VYIKPRRIIKTFLPVFDRVWEYIYRQTDIKEAVQAPLEELQALSLLPLWDDRFIIGGMKPDFYRFF